LSQICKKKIPHTCEKILQIQPNWKNCVWQDRHLDCSHVVRPGAADAEHSGAVGIVEVRVVDVPETGGLKNKKGYHQIVPDHQTGRNFAIWAIIFALGKISCV
jgi:hypothetical protein